MKRASLMMLIFFSAGLQTLSALGPGDILLAIPTGIKALGPLALIPGAIQDSDSLPAAAISVGLLSVPNGVLMFHLLTGNPEGVTLWRKVVRVTDGLMTGALAGYGVWLMADNPPGGFNDIAGALMIAAAVPMGIAFLLDFIPFPMERKARAE